MQDNQFSQSPQYTYVYLPKDYVLTGGDERFLREHNEFQIQRYTYRFAGVMHQLGRLLLGSSASGVAMIGGESGVELRDLGELVMWTGTVENAAVIYSPRPNKYVEHQAILMVLLTPGGTFLQPLKMMFLYFMDEMKCILKRTLRGKARCVAYKVYKCLWRDEQVHAAETTQVENCEVGGGDKYKGVPSYLRMCNITEYPMNEAERTKALVDNVECYSEAPKTIHVALLNQCNLKCVMCPYHSRMIREQHGTDYFSTKEVMEVNIFRKIASYVGKNRSALQFGEFDEPMLHPRFMDCLRIARAEGVASIHMTTNGTMLTDARIADIASVGIESVMVSIDAADAATYKKIRGGDYKKLVQQTRKLFSAVGLANKSVSIIRQCDIDDTHVESFVDYWLGNGANAVTVYQLGKRGERLEHVYKLPKRYTCAVPWRVAFVYPSGDVTACCKMLEEVAYTGKISLGSLRDSSFEDVWKGREYSRLRRELLENSFKEFPCCQDCESWAQSTYFTKRDKKDQHISYNMTCSIYRR